MRSSSRLPVLLAMLVLVVAALYPALVLERPVFPEESLPSVTPWLGESTAQPSPSPLALHAATRLGPRMHGIRREGIDLALWNPHIGGGRPGWLAHPEEGGAPLPLAAAFLAREGWQWTALVALQLGLSLVGAFLLGLRLRLSPWAATAGGLAYALSGASVANWLSWQGSAIALGPWMVLPALMKESSFRVHALAWWAACLLALFSGPPAYAFILLAVLMLLLGPHAREVRHWLALSAGLCAAVAVRAPALWLDRWGWEQAPVRWTGEDGPLAGGLRSLIRPFAAGDPAELALAELVRPLPDPGTGFLGILVLILAIAGLTSRELRFRRLWGLAAAVALVLLLLPEVSWLGLPAVPRPAGIMALAAAALAGGAIHGLLQRTPHPWREAFGAIICTLLIMHLLPAAARRLPFATRDARLWAWPLSDAARPGHGGVTALGSTLPPDAAMFFALPDVRASELSREPRYAALLGTQEDGRQALAGALEHTAARLGAEVILEPANLRLISQQVFSGLEIVDLPCDPRRTPAGRGLCRIPIPENVFRIGIALPPETNAELYVRRASGLTLTRPDHALDPESRGWRWTVVPEECITNHCGLELLGIGLPNVVSVAFDRSWVELQGEESGVRIWKRQDVQPPVFAPALLVPELDPLPGPADAAAVPLSIRQRILGNGTAPVSISLKDQSNHRWEAEVKAAAPVVLVARIKHRPRLWRVRIDGREAASFPADWVWTGVVAPAGSHRVTWQLEIPREIWILAGCGLAGVLVLAVWRRWA